MDFTLKGKGVLRIGRASLFVLFLIVHCRKMQHIAKAPIFVAL